MPPLAAHRAVEDPANPGGGAPEPARELGSKTTPYCDTFSPAYTTGCVCA